MTDPTQNQTSDAEIAANVPRSAGARYVRLGLFVILGVMSFFTVLFLLTDPATYENVPEDIWQRIKIKSPKPRTLAILRELAAWRENQAQERDVPRTWILRDDTLADMAAQAPQNVKALKKIRNMPADLANNHVGKALLQAIQKGQQVPKNKQPQPQKRQPLNPAATATVDVLRMLLKIQSAEHEVAPKLIASKEDLEALALDDAADVAAMKGWRYEIFGKEALDLKKGKLAIGLKDSKITKHKIA